MSAQEIIEELSKLSPEEQEKVRAKLQGPDVQRPRKPTIGEVLLSVAGTAEGLPPDYSNNLDHYLYGGPKHTE